MPQEFRVKGFGLANKNPDLELKSELTTPLASLLRDSVYEGTAAATAEA